MPMDFPFSVNFKWINGRGIEVLWSIRAPNDATFASHILAANNLFPSVDSWGGDEMRMSPEVAAAAKMAELSVNGRPVDLADREAIVERLTDKAAQQRREAVANAGDHADAARARKRAADKDTAPRCNVHRAPMLRSKYEGVDWFCPLKDDDGAYCTSKIYSRAA